MQYILNFHEKSLPHKIHEFFCLTNNLLYGIHNETAQESKAHGMAHNESYRSLAKL